MRVIKFRAWDNELSRMFYPGDGYTNEIHFGFNMKTGQPESIGIGEHDYEGVNGFNWYNLNAQDSKPYPTTLMQFTSLVDINGVEIYEGDILEYKSQSVIDRLTGATMTTYRKPIIWNENECCWWVGTVEKGFKPDKETDDGKFLIVGNIHQNPELFPANDNG